MLMLNYKRKCKGIEKKQIQIRTLMDGLFGIRIHKKTQIY